MGGRRKFCGNNSLIVTLIFFYEYLDVNDNHILKGNLRKTNQISLLSNKQVNVCDKQ
jgi:hypothetical protein